jgi:hypothetical protein
MDGSYTQTLNPAWWNNTGDIQLTINISPTGQVLAFDPFAAGPVVNINSTAAISPSDNASNSSDPDLKTSGAVAQGGGLPKGSIAAAVLLPIIIIIVGVAIYVKISRKKQAEKSRRFSHVVNARMSRISGDWQVGEENGKPGPRNSSASGLRMSNVFGQGSGHGVQMDVRDSMARVSIANMPYTQRDSTYMQRDSTGPRTSRFNPPSIGTRQSRISFAPDVNASRERLSTYSTGRASRTFPAEDAPPVPRGDFGRSSTIIPISTGSVSVYDTNSIYAVKSHDEHDDAGTVLSPTQTSGPVPLTNDDINNIEIAPALSLMRTGNPAAKSSDDLLLAPPVSPAPTHVPVSPFSATFNAAVSPVGSMPMQPQTTFSMSPDDMLKQYARTKAKNPFVSNVTTPAAVYSPATQATPLYTATGMRNLTGDASLSH